MAETGSNYVPQLGVCEAPITEKIICTNFGLGDVMSHIDRKRHQEEWHSLVLQKYVDPKTFHIYFSDKNYIFRAISTENKIQYLF